MTDHPIIYSAAMARALLEGRKTQTRRMAWRISKDGFRRQLATPWRDVQPGDRLWCRENALYWMDNGGPTDGRKTKVAAFQADGYELQERERWTPSIHMPRWASRLTLIVTATKIERLQEISEVDAIAEGIEWVSSRWRNYFEHDQYGPGCLMARDSFRTLWTSLHGPGSWDANPEVVALTFRIHLRNIDQMQEAA